MNAPNPLTLLLDVDKVEIFEKYIGITFSLEDIENIDCIKINDMEFKRVR